MRAELESIRQYHTNMAARIRELSNQLEATREQQANTRNSVGKILTFLSQVYHAHTQNGIAPAGLLANIAPITENKPMDSLVSASPPSDLGLQPIVEPTPARPMKRARIEDAEPRSSDDVAISELADLSSMPPPPMVKPQRSLGAEAARALPYDMQVCAMARRQCAHGPALADLAIASSRGRRRHLAKVCSETLNICTPYRNMCTPYPILAYAVLLPVIRMRRWSLLAIVNCLMRL